MTTIVVDSEKGFIAADRMAVSNDCEVSCECPKIRQVSFDDGTHLLASSGMESSAQVFEDWYGNADFDFDEPPEPLEDMEDVDKFTTIILKPNREIWVADHFYRPYRIHSRWYATGTGGPFAWAVLVAGCGIDKAMKTAIKMDPNSGFGYDIVHLKS